MSLKYFKSFRQYFISIELISVLFLSIVFFIGGYITLSKANESYFQLHIKDGDKVHLSLTNQLNEAKSKLESFELVAKQIQNEDLENIFPEYSDIYSIDNTFKVKKIYKSSKGNKVFVGFSFYGGSLIEYFNISKNGGSFSDIMRGKEDNKPSIYYLCKYKEELFLGRIDLSYVQSFLEKYSQLSGNPVLFMAKDGFVMVASNPELNIHSLDLKKWNSQSSIGKTIVAGGKDWIPIFSEEGTLGVKVAVLIQNEFPIELRNLFFVYLLAIILGLIFLGILKNYQLKAFVLSPIQKLNKKILELERGKHSASNGNETYRFEELNSIHLRFTEMAKAIESREKSLHESKKIIGENLGQRNLLIRELETTKKQLEDAISQKDKFFSIIAHDLKSPFNGFLGLTRTLSENMFNMSIQDIEKFSGLLKTSAENVYSLIENLLEWSRLQRHLVVFDPVPINVKEIFKTNVELQNIIAFNKKISINNNIPENLNIKADINMLNIIIRNILSNAVKFTPKNGYVDINASENLDFVEFSIKDSGIGIPKKILDHLFTIGEKTSRFGTEGELSTGLGLILCHEYILRHKGSIGVESEEGKGATFKVRLPKN